MSVYRRSHPKLKFNKHLHDPSASVNCRLAVVLHVRQLISSL